ncbi:MAG: 2-dehydropantoate 2-reductase [Deltaproteobacteria bacterium]|nr:2-dehydropantoate 2-reductase [Deltaproteobacteria bacterium]
MSLEHPKVLIVGCGGIGGVLSTYLAAQQRCELQIRLRQGLREQRLQTVVGHGGMRQAPVLVGEQVALSSVDFALLTTQPNDVEQAVRTISPALSPQSTVVCFQNGLCEELVAPLVPAGVSIAGAVVAWGASARGAATFERTSAGGFTLGWLVPPAKSTIANERLERLAGLLSCVGPIRTTDNLLGARWAKLAFNCAISSLSTITGQRLGVLLRRALARRLALEIISEVLVVAEASKIAVEPLGGTLRPKWLAIEPSSTTLSLLSKHFLMLLVGAKYRRLRSSMLAALERGRTPPVDFLNGEIVRRAERLGIETPFNAAINELVLQLAAGRGTPSLEQLLVLQARAVSQVARGAARASLKNPWSAA